MAKASDNRLAVTLSPDLLAWVQGQAADAGMPVAGFAGLILRRALQELRDDPSMLFSVLFGRLDTQTPEEAQEEFRDQMAGMTGGAPRLPAQAAPKRPARHLAKRKPRPCKPGRARGRGRRGAR